MPSTQLCPNCEKKNKIPLSERWYNCECGYNCDRDVKSAICIEKKIPMEYRKLTLGEIPTSTFFDTLNNIHGIEVKQVESLNQEAPTFLEKKFDTKRALASVYQTSLG